CTPSHPRPSSNPCDTPVYLTQLPLSIPSQLTSSSKPASPPSTRSTGKISVVGDSAKVPSLPSRQPSSHSGVGDYGSAQPRDSHDPAQVGSDLPSSVKQRAGFGVSIS